MRCAMRKNPVRVQFRPMSSITMREPCTSAAAADHERRRGGIARARSARRAPARPPRRPRHGETVALERARRARQSMRSVWSRLRVRSVTLVRPVGQQAGDQHARLHLRAGHRQLVVDPGQRRRRAPGTGRSAPRGRRASRPSGPAARPPVDGAAADRLVAVERPLARPAARRASPAAGACSVPELPTSMRRRHVGRRAQPDAADRPASPSRSLHARAPSARIASSVELGVVRRGGSCATATARRTSPRTAPRGARSTCRPAGGPCRAAAPRGRSGRRSCAARHGEPELLDQRLGAVGGVVACDPERRPGQSACPGRARAPCRRYLPPPCRAPAPPARRYPGGSAPTGAARGRSPPASSASSSRRRSSRASSFQLSSPRRRRPAASRARPLRRATASSIWAAIASALVM